jgi:hypothetical protein
MKYPGAASSTAEQGTFNPLVPGSNPGRLTASGGRGLSEHVAFTAETVDLDPTYARSEDDLLNLHRPLHLDARTGAFAGGC